MRLLALLVAATLLVTACRGGGDSSSGAEVRTIDAKASAKSVVLQTVYAMQNVESYHLTATIPTHPDDVRGKFGWDIEFAQPDLYRILVPFDEGATRQECHADTIEGGTVCYDVMVSVTNHGVGESLVVGETVYGRECADIDRDCNEWQQAPRGDVVVPVLSPSYLPQWPIVALEMARDLQTIGEEELDGEAVIHFQAKVNTLRAISENYRHVFEAAGVTTFGQECVGRSDGQEECRDTTYEDLLEQLEPRLSYSDANPAAVDV
jgi:hypothetical protein